MENKVETKSKTKSEFLTIRLVKSEMEAVKEIQATLKSRGIDFSLSAIIRTFLTSAFERQKLHECREKPQLLFGGV